MKKKSVLDFQRMKREEEKIVFLVTYDFHTAKCAEEAGVEILLIGDSIGMNVYGHDDTIPVTMDQMITPTQAVRRGAPNTFIIGDMPFGSYFTLEEARDNASRFYKEAGVDAVKLEGGVEVKKQIRAIVDAKMTVMGHIGLTPQNAGQLGGFKVQGRTSKDALRVIKDAEAVEKAGAFALLVEAVPPEVTEIISKRLKIPVLGIGAGPFCDGQLLLACDLLGLGKKSPPKFVKVYTPYCSAGQNFNDITLQAFEMYAREVMNQVFPDPTKHCYSMLDGELEKLKQIEK